MDDQPLIAPEHPPAHKRAGGPRSAAELAAQREAARQTMRLVAAKLRNRAARQRMQAVSCIALIAVLLLGDGVFFYFAQTIALNELKAQSDFISQRKAIDEETAKLSQDKDELARLRQQIAAIAGTFPKVLSKQTGQLPADILLRKVQLIDAKNGFAVGANGRILATSDGGATWQKRNSGVSDALYGVQFVDAKNGSAVGANGRILILTAPDTSRVALAEHASDMQGALKSIGIDATIIGPPWDDFNRTDNDATEQSRRADQDNAALATYEPKVKADATAAGLLNASYGIDQGIEA